MKSMTRTRTIRLALLLFGMSVCVVAQDSSPSQPATPPAPAFGQNAPVLSPENPPVSGLDEPTLELRTAGNVVHLTLMESDLLRHLVRNDGRVVSRKQILEEVWGLHEDTDTRAIDNFVVRLRKYIEKDPSHPQHLLTVRGVGYRFLPTPADT